MPSAADHSRPSPLLAQLRWIVRLRWMAGLAVVVGALLDGVGLHWYGREGSIFAVGASILLYNTILWMAIRSPGLIAGRARLLAFAWGHILPDLVCLTILTLLTGALRSPLLGLYVLHMVFASLLLPRLTAYGAATAAVLMLALSLWWSGRPPHSVDDALVLVGWAVTLLLTVYLANHIVRALRDQRRRLVRQNRRIAAMGRRLARQQQGMIQHEKMVAMGQMAAGITHEIANPLASMDSLLQLLQRKPEKLNADAVVTLRQQVERISRIVQAMSTFAHPNETQLQELPLNDVVEGAMQMLSFDPRMKAVRIERQYSPAAGSARLLPHALQQVIVNLARNAFDALAGVESPMLTIRTERSAGGHIVEVSDNGQGIAPEHLPHLFEPFFTTKPLGKGTGLGLSISYSLMQKQGGRIEVSSQPGKGATFTIRIPISEKPGG